MEISKERLIQLSKTNARAKVMVKQWYPEVFNDDMLDRYDSLVGVLDSVMSGSTAPTALGFDTVSDITSWCYSSSQIPTIRVEEENLDANGNRLITGKWYTNGNEYLMIYNEDRETKGFFGGSWGSQWSFTGTACQSRPATAVEIGHYLKRECAIRGYSIESDGTSNFVGLGIASQTPRYPISEWYYDIRNDSLYTAPLDMGGFVVYRGGEWARLKTDVQFYG